MRNCTQCGTPLQPGATNCPRCGKFVEDQRFAYPPAQQAPQPYYPYPNASFAAQQPRPPRTTKTSKGATILLSLLALLTMSGGVGLIYFTTVAQPAQYRAQATATVQTILTSVAQTQAQATVTAHTQAQATAQAKSRAQATATTLQNNYNTITNGTPALTSPLTGQDGANWDIYNAQGGGGCGFTNNTLQASIFQQHTYVPCFAQATSFGDFAFQAQMTILRGDGGGLVFRADSANAKFYFFRIGHDGVFSLFLISDAKTNTDLLDDTSPAVKPVGQTNLITIIARGSSISIYINKQFVDTITDTTYSSGKIGIFADDTTNNTDVAFSDVNVWALV